MLKKNIKLDDIKKKYFDKNHRDSIAAKQFLYHIVQYYTNVVQV